MPQLRGQFMSVHALHLFTMREQMEIVNKRAERAIQPYRLLPSRPGSEVRRERR